ncbi:MAG: peptidylprolyl isomerase [Pisciglobus halotolerans]|nr:peptidylprolyl isomerase [Pisciglobus halotolerans]
MMKKLLLTATAVLTGLTIAGCSSETVASSTAGKISQDELYESMKESYGEQALQQLLIKDILTDKYGDKVTDKEVDAQFNKEKENYGGEDQFDQVLSYSGYTKESYKDLIRYSLLMETAVKENTEFSDKEIKKAYDDYDAPTTASHILVSDEKTAKDIIKQLDNGADFAKLAKEKSTDTATAKDGGKVTFSKGEMVPEFEEAVSKLKEGEYTEKPVKSEYGFHVIKLDKKGEKGSLEEEKDTVKEKLASEKLADNEYVADVLSKLFKDANIIINDDDLKHAMDAYLNPQADSSNPEQPANPEEQQPETPSTEDSTDASAEKESADDSSK